MTGACVRVGEGGRMRRRRSLRGRNALKHRLYHFSRYPYRICFVAGARARR